jgi:PAS domain-containing protein
MLSTAIEQRRWVTAHLIYEGLLVVLGLVCLGVLYVRFDRLMLQYLEGSARTSVQEAALEVARPVIHQVANDGVPPAAQTWGLRTVRPLTAATATNAFERQSLALAKSANRTVHSSWQRRGASTVVEFAIADGRGGVATTDVEIVGGLTAVEARFQRLYKIASLACLVVCVMLGVAAVALWRLRTATMRAAHAEVRAAERAERITRLVRAARASNEGHWELDYESGRFWRSATFEELLGRELREATDTIEEFERMPHPDDTDRVRTAFEQHVETGAPFDVELRLRCANGAWRWFRCRATGEFVQGTMTRLCGSMTDVERHHLMRDELLRDALAAEERVAAGSAREAAA